MKALADNVSKFENQHGEIKDIDPAAGMPINFGGPTPLALLLKLKKPAIAGFFYAQYFIFLILRKGTYNQ